MIDLKYAIVEVFINIFIADRSKVAAFGQGFTPDKNYNPVRLEILKDEQT